MPGMITRCPKCATAFRISENHLKSAQGMVRCGSCLNVFNAKTYIESSASTSGTKKTAPPSASTSRSTPSAKSTPVAKQSENLSASSVNQSRPVEESHITKRTTEKPASSAEAKKSPPAAKPKLTTFDKKEQVESLHSAFEENDEEAWALALLNDEGDFTIDDAEPTEQRKEKSSAPQKVRAQKVEPKPSIADHSRNEPAADKSAQDDTQHQPIIEGAAPLKSKTADPEEQEFELSPELQSINKREKTLKETPEEVEQKAQDTKTPRTPKPKPTPDNNSYLASIQADELSVDWGEEEETPSRKKWIWFGLIGLTAIALFAQVAWLQFHNLNKTDPYRGWYAHACAVLGCELPPLEDLSAIVTSNLVVRTHPSNPDALIVDAIIKNTAPFEQTFPSLVLTFTNVDNKAIAARKFTPDTYLGGELTGRQTMPRQQPIHITLEIRDPGDSAVGYKIEVSK